MINLTLPRWNSFCSNNNLIKLMEFYTKIQLSLYFLQYSTLLKYLRTRLEYFKFGLSDNTESEDLNPYVYVLSVPAEVCISLLHKFSISFWLSKLECFIFFFSEFRCFSSSFFSSKWKAKILKRRRAYEVIQHIKNCVMVTHTLTVEKDTTWFSFSKWIIQKHSKSSPF